MVNFQKLLFKHTLFLYVFIRLIGATVYKHLQLVLFCKLCSFSNATVYHHCEIYYNNNNNSTSSRLTRTEVIEAEQLQTLSALRSWPVFSFFLEDIYGLLKLIVYQCACTVIIRRTIALYSTLCPTHNMIQHNVHEGVSWKSLIAGKK